MLDIFVCDDDRNITEFLKFFIMKHFDDDYSVITMNECQKLIGLIEIVGHVPDILIMDINLQDGNGIETVKLLQNKHPRIKVIYLTGVIQYATPIFETNPAYFLVKPIKEDQMREAITKVSRDIERERNDSVVLKLNGSEIILFTKEILYVESQGRKLIVHMTDGRSNVIYEKMDIFQEKMGGAFVRSHKSFLINMRYIRERTNKEFYLMDGTVLPISKANLKEAKVKFVLYLGEA